MENGTDFVISQKFWTLANSFGLNTNILETNLINLGVVLGLLVYFGKGVCADWIFGWNNWIRPIVLKGT